jgi:hypothetical protein
MDKPELAEFHKKARTKTRDHRAQEKDCAVQLGIGVVPNIFVVGAEASLS